MCLDTRCDGKNIGIKDDVLRRITDNFRQYLIGALADFDFLIHGLGLAPLIERHDHDTSAVAFHQSSLLYKGFFALFKADRIDNPFALDALQSCFNH